MSNSDPCPYELRIYLFGMPGYFAYTVNGRTRAMVHLGEIQRTGYRRINEDGRLDWYSPARISEMNVIGPDLDSSYPDTFNRT